MEKIASPQELVSELQKILASTEEPNPSREKIAQSLLSLADRVAKEPAGVRERGRAVKDLVSAMALQYPNVPKKEIGKLIDSAVSGVGYKIKELNKKTASEHTAGNAGSDVFYRIIPQRDFIDLYDRLEEEDEQSAQLLVDVATEIQDQLNISSGAQEALSRVMGVVEHRRGWDVALIRNNVFKAAHSLGMRLPSHSF